MKDMNVHCKASCWAFSRSLQLDLWAELNSPGMPRLAVSVLDCDPLHLSEAIMRLCEAGIKHFHLDIIDTTFTDNISLGLSTLKAILGLSITCSIHFMIASPLKLLKNLNLKEHASHITAIYFHDLSPQALQDIKRAVDWPPKVQAGRAVCPDETLSLQELRGFDSVLIMTVHPGRGGQQFIASATEKIAVYKKEGFFVAVDGGISLENCSLLKTADEIVVGSAITRAEDANKVICDFIRAGTRLE